MALKNCKGQMISIAFMFLIVGLTFGTSFHVKSLSSSAIARADFYESVIEQANELESTRRDYADFLDNNLRTAIERSGYDSENICYSRISEDMYEEVGENLKTVVEEEIGEEPDETQEVVMPWLETVNFGSVYTDYYCCWDNTWKSTPCWAYNKNFCANDGTCEEKCAREGGKGEMVGEDGEGTDADRIRCQCLNMDRLEVKFETTDPLKVIKQGVEISYDTFKPFTAKLETDPDAAESFKRMDVPGGKTVTFDFDTVQPKGDKIVYAVKPEGETYYCCLDKTWKSEPCWANNENFCSYTPKCMDTRDNRKGELCPNNYWNALEFGTMQLCEADTCSSAEDCGGGLGKTCGGGYWFCACSNGQTCAERCDAIGKTGQMVGTGVGTGDNRYRCECDPDETATLHMYTSENGNVWTLEDEPELKFKKSVTSGIPIFGGRTELENPYRYLKVEIDEKMSEAYIYVENFCQMYTYLEPYWTDSPAMYGAAKFSAQETLTNPEVIVIFSTITMPDIKATITLEAGENENALAEIGTLEDVYPAHDDTIYYPIMFRVKLNQNAKYFKVSSTAGMGMHHVRIAIIDKE